MGGYRRVILDGQLPDFPRLAALYLVAGGLLALGAWWFGRTAAVFADIL